MSAPPKSDAGAPSPEPADGGQLDAGPITPDSGVPDSGVPDSGVPDSGVPDGGPNGVPLSIVTFLVEGTQTHSVVSGTTVSLQWTVEGARECSLSENDRPGDSVDPVQGTAEKVVNETMVFTLNCLDEAEARVSAAVTVDVLPAPAIVRFDASPSAINLGESSTLTWETSDATACDLNGDSVPFNGTQTVSPDATTTYTLACSSPGGAISNSLSIAVAGSASVVFFRHLNGERVATVDEGESSTLEWETDSATSCLLDGSPVAPTDSQVVTAADNHVFVLECVGGGASVRADAVLNVRRQYWHDATRPMATTPNGNTAAISCHNCYVTSSSPALSLSGTLTKIHSAQAKGADLIEIDIKEQNGVVRVEHADDGGTNGAEFADVLADADLQNGNQVLLIELKETLPTEEFAEAVLDQILASGIAASGRPVAMMAFRSARLNLELISTLLNTRVEYQSLLERVKLNEIYGENQFANAAEEQEIIIDSAASGFHGVAFSYRSKNLFRKSAYAREQGLGIFIYTIPSALGDVFVGGMREIADMLAVDYPIDISRGIVEENNALAYIDVSRQRSPPNVVQTFVAGGTPSTHAVNGFEVPDLLQGEFGDGFFGGYLNFDAALHQFLRLGTGSNSPDFGILVTAAVGFDILDVPEGARVEILSKADSGGFTLKLHKPVGEETQLLFSVFVNGVYEVTTYPTSNLNLEDTYFIIAGYDGDGGLRIYIDNSNVGVTNGSASGGVVINASPIVLGADPQGPNEAQSFFTGRVQYATVLDWGPH